MRIYIHTGNHNNQHGIGDTVLFLKNALQDCGYTACVSHVIHAGYLNILTENFTADQAQELAKSHAAGARFIMIGTEPVINGTFNGGLESSHWHYSNSDYWKGRFDAFKQAVAFASAIWVLAETMLPGYQSLFPQWPIRFLPHGYVNDFATVRQRAESERDIDFYFSGSLTDHRRQILRQLMATHTLVYNDPNTPEYLRQDHLSRSKVCLSLRLSPNNQIPSVSRMHYHLQNKSFLLHEAYEQPCPLDPFVMQVPNDDVAGWAVASLELLNRREIAEAAHANFKAQLPMTELLPPLLDEAINRAFAKKNAGSRFAAHG